MDLKAKLTQWVHIYRQDKNPVSSVIPYDLQVDEYFEESKMGLSLESVSQVGSKIRSVRSI